MNKERFMKKLLMAVIILSGVFATKNSYATTTSFQASGIRPALSNNVLGEEVKCPYKAALLELVGARTKQQVLAAQAKIDAFLLAHPAYR
ncbi:unnamed protein product [Sphagnum balticum]